MPCDETVDTGWSEACNVSGMTALSVSATDACEGPGLDLATCHNGHLVVDA